MFYPEVKFWSYQHCDFRKKPHETFHVFHNELIVITAPILPWWLRHGHNFIFFLKSHFFTVKYWGLDHFIELSLKIHKLLLDSLSERRITLSCWIRKLDVITGAKNISKYTVVEIKDQTSCFMKKQIFFCEVKWRHIYIYI